MEDTPHIKINRHKADQRVKEAALRAFFNYEFPVIMRLANRSKRVHTRYQFIK